MLAATVAEAARRFGDHPAFATPGAGSGDIEPSWTLSFRQLDLLSDEAAVGLGRLGVVEGSVVALALPSTPEYVVAYVAAAKLGAVTVGLNPRATDHERAAMIEVIDPALVLSTSALAGGLSGGSAPARRVEVIELAPRPDGLLGDLRRGLAGHTPEPLAADPDRPVTIVLTSGTTGTPKGAVFTGAELAAVCQADTGGRWGGGAAMLSGTQLAHIGFMTKLPWYLRTASTVHLVDRWRAHDVLRLIAAARMPSIGGVAPQLALLLREPDFDEFDLSAVKTIVMGGALSPPALVREARRRIDAAYSIRYSSTESGGIGTATAFDADEDEALFTVGRPRPGVDLEIRDPDDGAVAPGEVGEICLRSPTQLRRYWRDPEATAATLRGGWVHSGDLGRIDEAGCLRLAGRAKEMFVRGGYNVYPLEVEAVLASHPEVREVAVVPRPDPVMGEIGVAVIVPRQPDEPVSLDELRRFGAERLSHHKLPEAVRVVDALPLTPMQKVDRRALADGERIQPG
jgi:acyl-CoA synthetase (AMP-forming)/AMP-acid ligase II